MTPRPGWSHAQLSTNTARAPFQGFPVPWIPAARCSCPGSGDPCSPDPGESEQVAEGGSSQEKLPPPPPGTGAEQAGTAAESWCAAARPEPEPESEPRQLLSPRPVGSAAQRSAAELRGSLLQQDGACGTRPLQHDADLPRGQRRKPRVCPAQPLPWLWGRGPPLREVLCAATPSAPRPARCPASLCWGTGLGRAGTGQAREGSLDADRPWL